MGEEPAVTAVVGEHTVCDFIPWKRVEVCSRPDSWSDRRTVRVLENTACSVFRAVFCRCLSGVVGLACPSRLPPPRRRPPPNVGGFLSPFSSVKFQVTRVSPRRQTRVFVTAVSSEESALSSL